MKFEDRRKMPRIVFDSNIPISPEKYNLYIVASGNLDYYIRYGLVLAKSHNKTNQEIPIVFNCIDFPLSLARSIATKASIKLDRIFFCKTQLNHKKAISQEEKTCLYKTIRFEVAHQLQKKANCSVAVIDIDALFVSNISDFFKDIRQKSIDAVFGSTYDLCNNSLYESSLQNYPWRTIKAGFSYYNNSSFGKAILSKICQKLFNYNDPIPPMDSLKMYNAYYGDQIAILLTLLEFKDSSFKNQPNLSCEGFSDLSPISFENPGKNCGIWIPPASYRKKSFPDASTVF